MSASTFQTPTFKDVQLTSAFPDPELYRAIHAVASTLEADIRPKLTGYANGYTVAFRNEQGDRVCVLVACQATAAQIEQALRAAWGWKLSELASPATVARLYEP